MSCLVKTVADPMTRPENPEPGEIGVDTAPANPSENPSPITDYHAKYYAHALTRRSSSDNVEKFCHEVGLGKSPTAVLHRCKDDYSLEVAKLPQAVPEPGQQPLFKGRS